MTSVSLVDWKIEPRRMSVGAQRHRVGQIAVVGDREAALGELGEQAAGRCAARSRRWSNSGHGRSPTRPGELADDVVAVEIAGDMAHRAVRVEMVAVEAGDAGGFLPAVLERVEAERDEARGGLGTPDAEDAALLAQLVVVERVGRQHELARIHLEGLMRRL